MILFFAAVFCSADQVLPRLLMEPMKASFGLKDTQTALLVGFSFFVSMSVFALPLSWVADRWDRVRLLGLGVAVWCLATVFSGFAGTFWTLFLLRMGVGLGEAVVKPTAYSLLADLFPSRNLTRPLAILALGTLLGEALAMNGGGLLYEAFVRAAPSGQIAQDFAWRATMVVLGAAGLLVAVASLWIPEPRRGTTGVVSLAPLASGVPLVRYIRASTFFYGPFLAAMCVLALFVAGFGGWIAPFFGRTYGWSLGQIGQAIGTAGLACGLLGLPLGVWANGRIRKSLRRDAPVITLWIMLAIGAVPIVLTPLAPSGAWAIVGYVAFQLPAVAATVVAPAVYAAIAPSHLRARMIAISSFVIGVFGLALGPVLYGAVRDLFFPDPGQLGVAMAATSAVLISVFIPLLIMSAGRFDAAARLARESGPNALLSSDVS